MAASIWSVDEITPAGEAAAQQVSWVKLVHYTDYAMPGWRYVLAATDCLAGEDTQDDPGDPKLHFGRSFEVNYAQLPEASLSGFPSRLVTANSLDALARRRYVEEALANEIRRYLEESPPPQPPRPRRRPRGPRRRRAPRARLCVYNVHQGDTILAELPEGTAWLIDAYSWTKARYDQIIDHIRSQRIRSIDRLLLTHFHADHIRRAPDAADDLAPREVIVPPHVYPTAPARNVLRHVFHLPGRPLRVLSNAEQISIGGLDIALTTTDASCTSSLSASPNEHGIALGLSSQRSVALLPGDIPAHLIRQLLPSLDSPAKGRRFYKVTHHCSATGRDQHFPACYKPTCAVTSCGRSNRYGHPDATTRRIIDCITKGQHFMTFDQDLYIAFTLD